MKQQIYLIQGIFFQKGHTFGLANKPGIGTAVTISDTLLHSVFSGVIVSEDNDSTQLVGEMMDHYGKSVIMHFMVSVNKVSFIKTYKHRGDIIEYVFTKKRGNIWIGGYNGRSTGEGDAHLILTPVEESFFEPMSV